MRWSSRTSSSWFSCWFLCRAVCLLVLLAPAVSQAQDVPRYEQAECPFYVAERERDAVECGWLYVPENRDVADGAVIELAVAIVKSTGPNPAPEPVLYLEGGPGGSALAGIQAWYQSDLRAEYDIVLLDQRGTGYSYPSLNCPEYDDYDIEEPILACRERLINEGVDLAAYNSAQNAADVADLVQVLPYEKVNLFGVSYGTRLALTVMRDHPQVLRSVILDAVYPPQVDSYAEYALRGYQAFEELLDSCAADTACNAAFPDLRSQFYGSVPLLNADPLILHDGTPYYGDDLVDEVFSLMYDQALIPYLPRLIAAAAERDVDTFIRVAAFARPLSNPQAWTDEQFDLYLMEYLGMRSLEELDDYLQTITDEEYNAIIDAAFGLGGGVPLGLTEDEYDRLLADYLGIADMDALYEHIAAMTDEEFYELEGEALGLIDDDSEGMFNSVECMEELPFNNRTAAQSRSNPVPVEIRSTLLLGMELQFTDCELWNVPPANEIETEPITSSLPTLVMSGQFDPITPPEWGESAADHLPNSYVFVFPGMSHGTVDMHPCPTQIALAFLRDPLSPPDAACIQAMPPPEFDTGTG